MTDETAALEAKPGPVPVPPAEPSEMESNIPVVGGEKPTQEAQATTAPDTEAAQGTVGGA